MDEGFARGKHLLDVDDVAEYLGVEQTTVQRWCREGSMPAMKIGKEWRIRREALDLFLRRSERPATLVGQLRSFMEVPDNVLAIAQDREKMLRESTAGELISVLYGPCAGAKGVALDPLPEMVAQRTLGLVSLSRECFMDLVLSRGWPSMGGER